MSKTAKDYTITTTYGCLPGYPINPCGTGKGFHQGVDRAMPVGVPVVVNGVQIGKSGNTGYSTGPHLHLGRFVNGVRTNPGTAGFSFASAIVTQIDQIPDDANGKYVRVQADGASWVYLHLSEVTCRVGQKLVASPSLPSYLIVRAGEGLGAIAKRALFKDWFLPTRWAAISKLNTGSLNWLAFNNRLQPGQRVKVR